MHTGTSDPRTGDRVDIAAIYEATWPQLRRIAAGLTLAAADAEDALHDAYVVLLQRGPTACSGMSATDTERWLVRVLVNRCLLLHRRRGRWRRWLARSAGWWRSGRTVTGESGCEASEARQVTRAALEDLPEDERVCVVLRYFCELDSAEIAVLLEIPAGTVRSRLRRGRLALAEPLLAKGLVDHGA